MRHEASIVRSLCNPTNLLNARQTLSGSTNALAFTLLLFYAVLWSSRALILLGCTAPLSVPQVSQKCGELNKAVEKINLLKERLRKVLHTLSLKLLKRSFAYRSDQSISSRSIVDAIPSTRPYKQLLRRTSCAIPTRTRTETRACTVPA